MRGVRSEGLLLVPKRPRAVADVIALPDADQTPEQLVGLAPGIEPEAQFARRLAESGCRVIVPALVDRADTFSAIGARGTNQPHREFLYRPAFEMGRHVIGYEVQKVLAAVDWFAREAGSADTAIGVAGYGEGGLLALVAAALDTRVDATLVAAEQRDQREIAAFHLERGRRLFERDQNAEAIAELRRTIFLAPYEGEAHLLLGRIYLRTGRLKEAIDALTIAVWSDPNNVEAQNLLKSVR